MRRDSSEREKIETKRFGLIKDLTILAGSVFGLSIALATKDSVNIRFILGEFFLFLALFSGVVVLFGLLSRQEYLHFFLSSTHLESNLRKENFLVEPTKILIKINDKQRDKVGKSLFFRMKIDYFYSFFFVTFLLGVFLIFFSLINFQNLINFSPAGL